MRCTLLRVVAERDAEVALPKLMVGKLKLQLVRRAREQYGRSSEQLTLTATEAAKPAASGGAAVAPSVKPPGKPRGDSEHVHLAKWSGVNSWDPKAFDSNRGQRSSGRDQPLRQRRFS